MSSYIDSGELTKSGENSLKILLRNLEKDKERGLTLTTRHEEIETVISKINHILNDEHDWEWDFDNFNDAVIKEIDTIGIPVKCSFCGLYGTEWWEYSNTFLIACEY